MMDPSAKTQPQMRRSYNVTDQWGRMWLISVEKSTGHPCGSIDPCFTDPLGTPMKYMRIPDDRPYTVVIDYAQWIADLNQANVEYDANRCDVGRQLYGERFDESKKPSAELMRIIGKPPRGVDEVERAAAGDRTLLGLSPDASGTTHLTDAPAPKAKRATKPAEA